jgi:hypothetical protein
MARAGPLVDPTFPGVLAGPLEQGELPCRFSDQLAMIHQSSSDGKDDDFSCEAVTTATYNAVGLGLAST